MLFILLIPALFFITQLQEPITKWSKLLPEFSTQVSHQIDLLDEAMESQIPQNENIEQNGNWFDWFAAEEVTPQQSTNSSELIETRLKDSMFTVVSELALTAPLILFQIFTVVILILFTLIYAPQLFIHYVKLFVSKRQRKRARLFALKAQYQLSRYILTVSIINTVLATLMSIFLFSMGLEDAMLLGVLVGLLNFMPFVGPIMALALIALGSFVQWGVDLHVLYVLIGATVIITIESQFLTPLLLAKHMRINPLIIILWLLLCGWLWGLIGVIISVPILVCIKLILSQSERTMRWVKLLTT